MLTSYEMHGRGFPIRVLKLRLSNFRNYSSLDLCFGRGITLIEGRNGQGKTNLLEAIYLMVIGRSPRSVTDRQMVRAEVLNDFIAHAQVYGEVATCRGRVNLQVDLSSGDMNANSSGGPVPSQLRRIQKTFRVNGAPKRFSDFTGILKAVLFAAEDMDLLNGPPAARRRYIDILTSQIVPGHVREVQEYQKVVTQRNHLLKSIRERDASDTELEFWDVQLSIHAARIMDARLRVIKALEAVVNPIHSELSGLDQKLSLTYAPSLEVGNYEDARSLSKTIVEELRAVRRREIGAGFCLIGPHRDDFIAELDGMEVGAFASRGQTRTVVLAMKLGEAQLISDKVGDTPVVLLDDVMSELDEGRRRHVFDRIKGYEQVIITTAETGLGDVIGDCTVRRISVHSGRVACSS